jgi:hypothetical protein
MRLFAKISQVFFHCLELEFELRQVGFQLFDLLGFGQELALKTAITTATFAAAVTRPAIAITLLVHGYSPLDGSTIKFRISRLPL